LLLFSSAWLAIFSLPHLSKSFSLFKASQTERDLGNFPGPLCRPRSLALYLDVKVLHHILPWVVCRGPAGGGQCSYTVWFPFLPLSFLAMILGKSLNCVSYYPHLKTRNNCTCLIRWPWRQRS
jgi:hypothetical protein